MSAELAVGHRAAHATPPLALGFALLGALLALGTMRALETDALDPWAFYAGIAAATRRSSRSASARRQDACRRSTRASA